MGSVFRQCWYVGKQHNNADLDSKSRFWFSRRPWRLKIINDAGGRSSLDFGTFEVFGSQTCVPHKLDVPRNQAHQSRVSHQFSRGWTYLLTIYRFETHGWNSRSRSLGLSDWSISSLTKPSSLNQRSCRATGKLSLQSTTLNMCSQNSNQAHQSRSHWRWSRSIKCETFWFQCYVICLGGQWSRD